MKEIETTEMAETIEMTEIKTTEEKEGTTDITVEIGTAVEMIDTKDRQENMIGNNENQIMNFKSKKVLIVIKKNSLITLEMMIEAKTLHSYPNNRI